MSGAGAVPKGRAGQRRRDTAVVICPECRQPRRLGSLRQHYQASHPGHSIREVALALDQARFGAGWPR